MQNKYSLSLSTIRMSAALLSLSSSTPNGNDCFIIIMLNSSLSSERVSLIIGILNEEQFIPAGNVTRYCVLFPSP